MTPPLELAPETARPEDEAEPVSEEMHEVHIPEVNVSRKEVLSQLRVAPTCRGYMWARNWYSATIPRYHIAVRRNEIPEDLVRTWKHDRLCKARLRVNGQHLVTLCWYGLGEDPAFGTEIPKHLTFYGCKVCNARKAQWTHGLEVNPAASPRGRKRRSEPAPGPGKRKR